MQLNGFVIQLVCAKANIMQQKPNFRARVYLKHFSNNQVYIAVSQFSTSAMIKQFGYLTKMQHT